jgi:hypothetical protein
MFAAINIVKFRDWEFEVDKLLTLNAYNEISLSGAEACDCNDCKNYVAYRDKVFPNEIKKLFNELGVDYRKEVEITSWEKLENGLHKIGGWFHFKGKLKSGKSYKVYLESNSYSIDLCEINQNFEIGFAEDNSQTFFKDTSGLIQIEFMTSIPWIIDKQLETK